MTQFAISFGGCYETSRTLKIKCFMHEIPKPLQVFESKFFWFVLPVGVLSTVLFILSTVCQIRGPVLSALAAFNVALVLMLLPFFF